MDLATLRTRISTALDNPSDVSTTEIEEAINNPVHEAEFDENWRHMETKLSGNLTSSIDYISIPTRYKMMKSLFITVDDEQKLLRKMDYVDLIRSYRDGSNVKDTPAAYAIAKFNDYIYVRPYPDQTYAYELITYNYSADLSDSNTSNWFLSNAWEVLFYGALVQLRANINDDEQIAKWQSFYDRRIAKLKKVHTDESFKGSPQQVNQSIIWSS